MRMNAATWPPTASTLRATSGRAAHFGLGLCARDNDAVDGVRPQTCGHNYAKLSGWICAEGWNFRLDIVRSRVFASELVRGHVWSHFCELPGWKCSEICNLGLEHVRSPVFKSDCREFPHCTVTDDSAASGSYPCSCGSATCINQVCTSVTYLSGGVW